MQVFQVNQIWIATPASQNFTSSIGNQWQSTGFPSGVATFTKQSSTSYLDITCEGDFLAGSVADDVGFGVYFNDGLIGASFVNTSKPGSICTISVGQGLDLSDLAAGDYTVQMKLWALNNSHPIALVSNAVGLKIVEYELVSISQTIYPDLDILLARLDAIEGKMAAASTALAA